MRRTIAYRGNLLSKKEFVEELSKKDAKHLAGLLFEERVHAEKLEEDEKKITSQINENILLKEVNRNLKSVLESFGATPHKYVVEYEQTWCEYRKGNGGWVDCWDDCYDCEHCSYHKQGMGIDTFSLYALSISAGELTGISATLNDVFVRPTRVIDESSGRVVWEVTR